MTVRVKCEKKIKTIILWSPTQQLIEQANNQKYSQKYPYLGWGGWFLPTAF